MKWWNREREDMGEEAERARRQTERKLRETRRLWPSVRVAHDRLADLVDDALRGGR